MNDSLGDRMKLYEKLYSGDEKLMPLIPACARLDGRAFHTFTHGLERPFDLRLSNLMVDTAKWLMEQTGASAAYTQSDEISLVWLVRDFKSQMDFGGRVQKLASILASMCSVYFNKMLSQFLPEKADGFPVFDCRVWSVPNEDEAINYLIWRQQDATRNSIFMAAQAHFSHKELMNKSCNEMQEMLFLLGINWSEYPEHFKNGTFVLRRRVVRPFTTDELDKLPPEHFARRNPNLTVKRSALEISNAIVTGLEDRVGFIFAN